MSSKIQGVREFMASCPLLEEIPLKDKHVDWTSKSAVNYGIMVDSDNVIKKFITGGGKCEYNFAIFVRKFAKLDAERLQNNEFLERLQNWVSEQNAAKNFPVMPSGCTPTKLSAVNCMLFEYDKDGKTGLYQIQFKLSYTKSGG